MAILDANGVPILNIAGETSDLVERRHAAFLESGDHEHLLTGALVYVHNPRPVGGTGDPDVTTFRIGGETLDEAAKSVVGAFDGFHAHRPPDWVASTDEDLARVLAEHYGCEVKSTDEELTA